MDVVIQLQTEAAIAKRIKAQAGNDTIKGSQQLSEAMVLSGAG
ncbi:hypothetical protein BN135_501 [Cronobacter muytjensii 530]